MPSVLDKVGNTLGEWASAGALYGAQKVATVVTQMMHGETPDELIAKLLDQYCTYDAIDRQGASGLGFRITARNVKLKQGISEEMHKAYGYYLTEDSGIELLDINIVLGASTPTTIVIKGVKLFAHMFNYRYWDGKDKFQVAEYIDDGLAETLSDQEKEKLSCRYNRPSCPGFDCCRKDNVPKDEDMLEKLGLGPIEGWVVRILKGCRVDVINIEAGLIGGDSEAPFSGQCLFEIPAIAAEVTNGADRAEEKEGWNPTDLLANVMNMELIFKIQKLEPDKWTDKMWKTNNRHLIKEHLFDVEKYMWSPTSGDKYYESRLSHFGDGTLEALKCTRGVLPAHKQEYTLMYKTKSGDFETTVTTEHGMTSVGYLPEARLMLYSRNQWLEIDLTAEVGRVQVYGFCTFDPDDRLGDHIERTVCKHGKNAGKEYVRFVGVGDIKSTFDFTEDRTHKDANWNLRERKGKKKIEAGITEYTMSGAKEGTLTRVNWQNFFREDDDQGVPLPDLPPLREGDLSRRRIDKKKMIIFPEGQLDLYVPKVEVVIIPPVAVENALYIIKHLHFSGVDAYEKRVSEERETNKAKGNKGREGSYKPNFPRLVETDGHGMPKKSNSSLHVYECITTDEELHAMSWRVAKGIHMRLVVDRPVLVIPSKPVIGDYLDLVDDQKVEEDTKWKCHERIEVNLSDFRMVTTASPEDIDLYIGKLKCSLHALAPQAVSNVLFNGKDFDALAKVSATIGMPSGTRHMLEHSIIYSAFEDKGTVQTYAPLKVTVSTNDPSERDEKNEQYPDSMDVQLKVTELDKQTGKALNGALGINLRGALIKTMTDMAEYHLGLAVSNGLFTEDQNVMLELNKMSLQNYVSFITQAVPMPMIHMQMFFSIIIKSRDFGVNSARACVMGSKAEPIFVVVKNGTIGIRMPGIEAEVPDRSLVHHSIGRKNTYCQPGKNNVSCDIDEIHKNEQIQLSVTIPYFVNEYILVELRPALHVTIPSIVVSAVHEPTGARNCVLVNHIHVAQKDLPDRISEFQVTLGQLQIASPVSAQETSFWFKILADYNLMRERKSAHARLHVSSKFPFLHKVIVSSSKLFLEANLSPHTAEAGLEFWTSFKTRTLTPEIQKLLSEAGKEDAKEKEDSDESDEEDENQEFPMPEFEIEGLWSTRIDFCNIWPTFGSFNRTGVSLGIMSFKHDGCFTTALKLVWIVFFFAISFDHFSTVMGWIVMLHNVITCNYDGAVHASCDELVGFFFTLPIALFSLFLIPCLVTAFGNGRWRRSFGWVSGLAAIALANMTMIVDYSLSGMFEDHAWEWNVWLITFWVVTVVTPALMSREMWVFQSTTRLPLDHAKNIQKIAFMVYIIIGCSQFIITYGSKDDGDCISQTNAEGHTVTNIWDGECSGWLLVVSGAVKIAVGFMFFVLDTCGGCCQDMVVTQAEPMREMINQQMVQPDYHILQQDKKDKSRAVSRTIFYLFMAGICTDITLWAVMTTQTPHWSSLPHYGEYPKGSFMQYTCRSCHVFNTNTTNGYINCLWVGVLLCLRLIAHLKEKRLTAVLKARYRDAVPRKPPKGQYQGVSEDNREGDPYLIEGLKDLLDESIPDENVMTFRKSFENDDQLRVTQSTESPQKENRRPSSQELVDAEYDSRNKYNNNGAGFSLSDEDAAAYFERANEERTASRASEMTTVSAFYDDSDEDDEAADAATYAEYGAPSEGERMNPKDEQVAMEISNVVPSDDELVPSDDEQESSVIHATEADPQNSSVGVNIELSE